MKYKVDIIFYVLVAVDVILTSIALSHGRFIETNILTDHLFQAFGIVGIVSKNIVMVSIIKLAELYIPFDNLIFEMNLILVSIWSFAVISNAIVLIMYF